MWNLALAVMGSDAAGMTPLSVTGRSCRPQWITLIQRSYLYYWSHLLSRYIMNNKMPAKVIAVCCCSRKSPSMGSVLAVTIDRGAKQRNAGAGTTTPTEATREHKQHATLCPSYT